MKKSGILIFLFLKFILVNSFAQESSIDTSKYPPLTTFTTQEDHADMMKQLGITELRSGPSGNPSAPNAANYDESIANPCPDLPALMITENGKKITTPAMWWNQRRPEIIEGFEKEVYGRIPENVPSVDWKVEITDNEWIGRIPVIAKKVTGYVDNSAYPLIDVEIEMMVVLPTNVEGPVPVLMMFGFPQFPAPAQPNRDDLEKINNSFKATMIKNDPAMKEMFEKYPAYQPIQAGKSGPSWFAPPINGESPGTEQLLANGWGYATISPASIQADNGAGLTRGIIGLTNKGQPRTPEQWGSLRAWAWGAARGLDYLETDDMVDATKVGIEGVSRYGKAALVTLAFEERFAVGLIGSSGKGGATLHRRVFGEAVESLAGSGEYHWMAGNYVKYGAEKSSFGKMTGCDLPVDSHQLIALTAPRLTFISYGIPEQGDALWLDQTGSYMATIAAQPAFTLLGAEGLGKSINYMTEDMPEPQTNLMDGELAWRQHVGGHTDQPNYQYFIPWASKKLDYEMKARGLGN
tara:strand:- start:16918 stop:18483 length:1566 start_codon:yes stop_codon:yes gene_type:complete